MRIQWTIIATLLCVACGCTRSAPPAPELGTEATIKDLDKYKDIVAKLSAESIKGTKSRIWVPTAQKASITRGWARSSAPSSG